MTLIKWTDLMQGNGLDSYRNYIGKDYSDYTILYVKHRDSDIVTKSNYEAIKRKFKFTDGSLELSDVLNMELTCIEVRTSHWAVGYIDTLLIRNDAVNELALAEEIHKALDDYPLLDEELYSEMEEEEYGKESVYVSLWESKDSLKPFLTFEVLNPHYHGSYNYAELEIDNVRICPYVLVDKLLTESDFDLKTEGNDRLPWDDFSNEGYLKIFGITYDQLEIYVKGLLNDT